MRYTIYVAQIIIIIIHGFVELINFDITADNDLIIMGLACHLSSFPLIVLAHTERHTSLPDIQTFGYIRNVSQARPATTLYAALPR